MTIDFKSMKAGERILMPVRKVWEGENSAIFAEVSAWCRMFENNDERPIFTVETEYPPMAQAEYWLICQKPATARKAMSIQDQVDKDKEAVAAAQAALDQAMAQLVADEEKLSTVQPQLDLLLQVELEMAKAHDGADDQGKKTLEAVQASIQPIIDQLKAVFSSGQSD